MFKNKYYIVTGGGTGIGRQVALDLESNGAFVYVLGRNINTLRKVSNNNIMPKVCDVSDYANVKSTFLEISKIDGLVNCAGINPSRNNITKK